MNLTKFFFKVSPSISSNVFPYFAKEKFCLLHFSGAEKVPESEVGPGASINICPLFFPFSSSHCLPRL